MEWMGAVGAGWVWRGGVEGCWDGAVECGRVELGWVVWMGGEGIGGSASVAPSATRGIAASPFPLGWGGNYPVSRGRQGGVAVARSRSICSRKVAVARRRWRWCLRVK